MKWIKLSEKLPDIDEPVLLKFKTVNIYIGLKKVVSPHTLNIWLGYLNLGLLLKTASGF